MKACHASSPPATPSWSPLSTLRPQLQGLSNMVAELRERGIGFTSLRENLDTTTPSGRVGGRPTVATDEVCLR
ncbi:hypothetical protein AB0D83_13915 [Streptomyces decoyicus]|uniref:hypothetical protein n=1 Tax=Streptomyces decoyicus TaxID=249567 RepID=UPI0033DAF9A1